MTITVIGPLWRAEIDVVTLTSPSKNPAMRALLVDGRDNGSANDPEPVSNTLLLLGSVEHVTVSLPSQDNFDWSRAKPSVPVFADLGELKALLDNGSLALLLVRAPADQEAVWSDTQLRCVAGELPLQALTADGSADDELRNVLKLPATTDPEPGSRTRTTVHASGLSIYGDTKLPWDDQTHSLPFLLTKEAGYMELAVENERSTADEARALTQSWHNFIGFLQPDAGPQWVTIEAHKYNRPPGVMWRSTDNGQTWSLNLGSREDQLLSVVISDRSSAAGRTATTSLARVVPDEIAVDVDGDTLKVTLRAGDRQNLDHDDDHDALKYSAGPADDAWSESFELHSAANVDVAFDPIDTARRIRSSQNLPTPDWAPGLGIPLEPALIWAFTPLDDGWAQLPVPNLTEKIYLDAQLDNATPDKESAQSAGVLRGAVSFGNDKHGAVPPGEQPWGIALTRAIYFEGVWELKQTGHALTKVDVTLTDPDLVINGLLWLATDRPTMADALPGLDDWNEGLHAISLRTLHDRAPVFPPVVQIAIEKFGFHRSKHTTQLAPWTWRYETQEKNLAAFVNKKVFASTELFKQPPPIVWRRHPTLPMVQALPLTQNQVPASHPSASRELYPFALDVDKPWRFGVSNENGAAHWPALQLTDATTLASAIGEADLPLVSLSLPGLLLDAQPLPPVFDSDGIGFDLTLRYRYDLPYTDEVQSLAQLPKAAGKKADASRTTDVAIAPPADPLRRDTFAAHWHRLSQQASLAQADAVDAIVTTDAGTFLQSLVEPYLLAVTPRAELQSYPGRVTFDSIELQGRTALTGIGGSFEVDESGNGAARLKHSNGATGTGSITLTAGSMAAWSDADNSLRDQRGLRRHRSGVKDNLIQTRVVAHFQDDGPGADYLLTSTLNPEPLQLTNALTTWALWLRDVPLRLNQDDGVAEFRRDEDAPTAQDINDPEATSRNEDFRSGYEWRLGPQRPADVAATAEQSAAPLSLFGLDFYPLTLDVIELRDKTLARIEIVGRLQLPVADRRELCETPNAVRVVFQRAMSGAALELQSVALESDYGEWPLALEPSGEQGGAPRLRVTSVALDGAGLRVEGFLRFVLFGAQWRVAINPLQFDSSGFVAAPNDETHLATPGQTPVWAVAGNQRLEAVTATSLALSLDCKDGVHEATLGIDVRLVDEQLTAGASQNGSPLEFFSAQVFYALVKGRSPAITDVRLFDRIVNVDKVDHDAASDTSRFDPRPALQVAWSQGRANGDNNPRTMALLPGLELDPTQTQGVAALTFSAAPGHDGNLGNSTERLPALVLQTAFIEALLQSAPEHVDASVLRSSRAQLSIGFITRWLGGEAGSTLQKRWITNWRLNGQWEIQNLISWPAAVTGATPDSLQLTLPVDPADGSFVHTRHTIRVLLNQHELPAEALEAGSDDVLLRFKENAVWRFPAVVEHRLVDCEARDGLWVERRTGGNERRFTTSQEVRCFAPLAMRSELETVDAAAISGNLDLAAYGTLEPHFRDAFVKSLDDLASDNLMLIVDASVPCWVRRRALTARAATTVQKLPNGSQQARVAGLDDFAPFIPGVDDTKPVDSTSAEPVSPSGWTLIAMPFFGRLQDVTRDTDNEHPLRIDPLELLRRAGGANEMAFERMLTSWRSAESGDVELTVSALETPVGRTIARLDPKALLDSYDRLHATASEAPVAVLRAQRPLRSVIAATPDSPAWISTEASLTRANLPPSHNAVSRLVFDGHSSTHSKPAPEFVNPKLDFDGDVIRTLHKDKPEPLRIREPGGWQLLLTGPAERGTRADDEFECKLSHVKERLTIESRSKSDRDCALAISQTVHLERGIYRLSMSFKPHPGSPGGRRAAKPELKDFLPGTRLKGVVITLYAAGIDQDTYRPDKPQLNNVKFSNRSMTFSIDTAGDVELGLRFDRGLAKAQSWHVKNPTLERLRDHSSPPGWHVAGVQLRGLSPGLHVAASPLAGGDVNAHTDRVSNTLALSPYLGIDFAPATRVDPTQKKSLLVSAELLCLDAANGGLQPVATHFWEAPEEVVGTDYVTRWARETQRRLAPSSALGVLRLRQIDTNPGTKEISVSYAFRTIDTGGIAPLAKSVFALRAKVDTLRFKDGRFGGMTLPRPDTIAPFELAAPQVTGLQPMHLDERPGSQGKNGESRWPWGWSGWRVSVKLTPAQVGVQGPVQHMNDKKRDDQVLWWQAPQHRVQMRSALNEANRPTAGLPRNFRAGAIRSMLPVLPNPPLPHWSVLPLPASADDATTSGSSTGWWRPVLPGGMNYILSGNRPGVPMALRHMLLRQAQNSDEPVLVSGSVPVQHRVPRPVALPANETGREQVALQPWASFFEPLRTARITTAPADEAFFAGDPESGDGARRVAVVLRSPEHGVLTSAWDGVLSIDVLAQVRKGKEDQPFDVSANNDESRWLTIVLTDGSHEFDCNVERGAPDADSGAGKWTLSEFIEHTRDNDGNEQTLILRDYLARQSSGHRLALRIRVGNAKETGGLMQDLALDLRWLNTRQPLPPLSPRFVLFEDPGYNRRLASAPAQAQTQVQVKAADSSTELWTVTLAADRSEYNPGGVVFLRYDWQGDWTSTGATLDLARVSRDGIERPLAPKATPTPSGALQSIALTDLVDEDDKPAAWQDGDVLQLTVAFAKDLELKFAESKATIAKPGTVVLRVKIVAKPSLPVPEAAYALLRRQGADADSAAVHCARFAWGPAPVRVELVNAQDLKSGIVRRRAVFRWQDTMRTGTQPKYAVQKITKSGSTHFPDFLDEPDS